MGDKIIHGIAVYDNTTGEQIDWQPLVIGVNGLPKSLSKNQRSQLIEHFDLDEKADPLLLGSLPILPEDFLAILQLFSVTLEPDFSNHSYQIEAVADDIS
jgi:hypothetical protein